MTLYGKNRLNKGQIVMDIIKESALFLSLLLLYFHHICKGTLHIFAEQHEIISRIGHFNAHIPSNDLVIAILFHGSIIVSSLSRDHHV